LEGEEVVFALTYGFGDLGGEARVGRGCVEASLGFPLVENWIELFELGEFTSRAASRERTYVMPATVIVRESIKRRLACSSGSQFVPVSVAVCGPGECGRCGQHHKERPAIVAMEVQRPTCYLRQKSVSHKNRFREKCHDRH
jgi:hypothetical protein